MKTQLVAKPDVQRRNGASRVPVDQQLFRRGKSNRPTITIEPGRLHKVPEEMAAALSHPQAQYFRRDRILVKASRVLEQIDKAGVARAAGAVAFIRADPDTVRRDVAKFADVVKYNVQQRNDVPADLELAHARAFIAAAPELTAIPIACGIASVPILRDDGSIFFTDGYDPLSQLIFDGGGSDFTQLQVQEAPTMEDVAAAHRSLNEPLRDFPFVSAVDRSVMLSAILSSVLRPVLANCPLHGFSAPSHGAGKSLLAEIISIICTGARVTIVTCGHSQEELEKRVDAIALAGDPIVCLDNVSRALGGDNLCGLLTSTSARIRVLGKSEQVTIACSTFWMATGTNLMMRGDMVRRSLVVRLDPNVESPESREGFAIPDLINWVQTNRMGLLRAIFTILRAHAQAGYPRGEKVLGSFPDWSRRVRGALLWLGEADPVDSQVGLAADDPVLAVRGALFGAIYRVKGDAPWTAFDLAELFNAIANGPAPSTPEELALVDALPMACPGGSFDASKLSYWLRSARDVIAGGLKLKGVGKDHANRMRFQLIRV